MKYILKKINIVLPLICLLIVSTSCWKDLSPEDLIRLKEAFKNQVEKFEKKKNQTNSKVSEGLETLGALKQALEKAKNEDKEFAKVYRDWKRVDRRVKNLSNEFEDLKKTASELFEAMETQSRSLNNVKNKTTLLTAISSARTKYNTRLNKTSKAIGKLKVLHGEAIEIVKALEVAAALNSFDDINAQMKSIESRVDDIMAELNITIAESKNLYEKKITELK